VKRRQVLMALVVLGLGALVLDFARRHYDPRRPRPEGWKAAWASAPLEPESSWAPDPLRRAVVQQLFLQASPGLTHCMQEYFHGAEGDAAQLELLIAIDEAGAALRFVESSSKPGLEPGLLPCVERVLERTTPVRARGLPASGQWRLGLTFLLPPATELIDEPWWERFVPDAFRSGGSLPIHVG
jgi:hypothetical protein